MKTLLTSMLLMLIFGNGAILASGYEITKVIEVGPGGGALVGTVKWSPDGTKLAYFDGRALRISDTLGVNREIRHFDLSPHRYEWLSDSEVIVSFWDFLSARIDTSSLVLTDIGSGKVSSLAGYSRGRLDNHERTWFEGPYLTVEGNAFYYSKVRDSSGTVIATVEYPESRYLEGGTSRLPEKNHIVDWGPDCVYMMTTDLTDTVRIAPKPYSHRIIESVSVNSDLTYWLSGGTLCRLADSTYVVLDTIAIEAVPGAPYCSFFLPSFNPRTTEVLFTLTCDNGTEYMVNRMGTFNYVTGEFTIIDPAIGMVDCERPAYAPGGLKIAFQSGGQVYILYRSEK